MKDPRQELENLLESSLIGLSVIHQTREQRREVVKRILELTHLLEREAFRRGRDAGYKEHQQHLRGQDMGQ